MDALTVGAAIVAGMAAGLLLARMWRVVVAVAIVATASLLLCWHLGIVELDVSKLVLDGKTHMVDAAPRRVTELF